MFVFTCIFKDIPVNSVVESRHRLRSQSSWYRKPLRNEMSPGFTQCPDCGWTGKTSDRVIDELERTCPVCDYVF